MVQWMNAQPKPKPEDNKHSEAIDLCDDNDENGKLGYLSCAFFISLGLVFNIVTSVEVINVVVLVAQSSH